MGKIGRKSAGEGDSRSRGNVTIAKRHPNAPNSPVLPHDSGEISEVARGGRTLCDAVSEAPWGRSGASPDRGGVQLSEESADDLRNHANLRQFLVD